MPYFSERFGRFIRRDPRARMGGTDPEDVLSDLVLAILESKLERPVRGIRLRWLYLDVLRRFWFRHRMGHVPEAHVTRDLDTAIDLAKWRYRLSARNRKAVDAMASGQTYDEASRVLGCSPASVHRNYCAARLRWRPE